MLLKRYYKNILASSLVGFDFVACKNEKDKQEEHNASEVYEVTGKDVNIVNKFGSKHGSEEVVAKKNEAILKILGDGRVIIVDDGDGKKTDFVLGSIDDLQKFANALEKKDNIKIVDGSWDFRFFCNDVRICGHETGFNITEADRFGDFLDCLSSLSKFGKDLEIPKMPLSIVFGEVHLNHDRCEDNYYKGINFWNLVKDHADLFEIEGGKFVIENIKDSVVIGSFFSDLDWNDIVEGSDVKPGWNKIFKLQDVRISWNDKGFFCAGDEKVQAINNLFVLEFFVKYFKDKNVKAQDVENFKLDFNHGDLVVSVCGGKDFKISQKEDFEKFLGCISSLKSRKAISDGFTIKIEVDSKGLKLEGGAIENDFAKSAVFWNAVKKYKDLFSDLPLKNVEIDSGVKGKIGDFKLDFDVFDSEDSKNIIEKWFGIFTKKSK